MLQQICVPWPVLHFHGAYHVQFSGLVKCTDGAIKTNLWLQKEKGRDKLVGIWDENIHTTIYKIINMDLLYSTGNYTQYLVMTYNGREW